MLIPKFEDRLKERIVKLYHSPLPTYHGQPRLSQFVAHHRERNARLGIWELDREMKTLQAELNGVQERIIEGKSVVVPFSD